MANIPEYESTLVPVSNDHPTIVRQPYNSVSDLDLNPQGPEEITNGYNGMKDPVMRLSQNMKLAMRHVGIKENAIPFKDSNDNNTDEWQWDAENGVAVPPVTRDITEDKYAVPEEKKYSDYGTVTRTDVMPFGEDDKAHEVTDTLVVTDPTQENNDDEEMVEAVPVLAVEDEQRMHIKLEGRRGETRDDPITEENYLTRPGMEVKTSETWISLQEAAEGCGTTTPTGCGATEEPQGCGTTTNPPAEQQNPSQDNPPAEVPEVDGCGCGRAAPVLKTTKRTYTKKTATIEL